MSQIPETCILSPMDRPGEARQLLAAGATELYTGVQPDAWQGRLLSASQRSFRSAHFADEATCAAEVGVATDLGARVHLALNAPLYVSADYDDLLGLLRRACGWGVHGVIAGDPGLLRRLSTAGLPLEVTLSTLAGAMNREAVNFFRGLGVRRVVLPRHLQLAEMAAIRAAHPDLAFEAFVLIGKCPNEEAFCSFQHVATDRRWPCEVPYELHTADGSALPLKHPLAAWHREWRRVDRRQACGLCGIPDLLRAGVHYLKVVGRGAPTAAKVANVELVVAFTGEQRGSAEARSAYRKRFGRDCDPAICYFPELTGRG